MRKVLVVSLIINILFLVFFIVFLINNKSCVVNFSSKLFSGNIKAIQSSMPAPHMPEWYYMNSRLWKEKRALYEAMPNEANEIIFVGNSLTFACNWAELLQNPKVKNRGIEGDNTEGLLERLDEITESLPDKIFLMMGVNDIGYGLSVDVITANYSTILTRIKQASPLTRVYVQSVLPIKGLKGRNNDSIIALNEKLQLLAVENSAVFINLYPEFLDSDGELNMSYSYDGLHLNTNGYLLWKSKIEKYVAE